MGFRTVDCRLATLWAAECRVSGHLCPHTLHSVSLLRLNLVGILHTRKTPLLDLLSNSYFSGRIYSGILIQLVTSSLGVGLSLLPLLLDSYSYYTSPRFPSNPGSPSSGLTPQPDQPRRSSLRCASRLSRAISHLPSVLSISRRRRLVYLYPYASRIAYLIFTLYPPLVIVSTGYLTE